MQGIEIFKQTEIKLNRKASNRIGVLFREYLKNPTQQIKSDVIEIYRPQIERRAAAAAFVTKGKISAVDYAQDLYLKLLEMLIDKDPQSKHLSRNISQTINNTKPTVNTLVSRGNKAIEKLTQKEVYDKASYKIDEKTDLQKAEEILDYAKKLLPTNEAKVLSKKLEGKQLDDIAQEMDLTRERVRQIHEKAMRRLNTPEMKDKYCHLFYEDNPPTDYHEPLTNVPDDMICIMLNNVIKDNGYAIGRVFNPELEGSDSYLLSKYPSFTVRIKLPKAYNYEEFKVRAMQISVKIFGKNILEFID